MSTCKPTHGIKFSERYHLQTSVLFLLTQTGRQLRFPIDQICLQSYKVKWRFEFLLFDRFKYGIKFRFRFQCPDVHKNWVAVGIRWGRQKGMHHGPSGAVHHESITQLTLLKVGDFREKVRHTYVCANNTDEFALVITRQCYGCYQTCWQKMVVKDLIKIMNERRNYHSLNMVNKHFETSNFVYYYMALSQKNLELPNSRICLTENNNDRGKCFCSGKVAN